MRGLSWRPPSQPVDRHASFGSSVRVSTGSWLAKIPHRNACDTPRRFKRLFPTISTDKLHKEINGDPLGLVMQKGAVLRSRRGYHLQSEPHAQRVGNYHVGQVLPLQNHRKPLPSRLRTVLGKVTAPASKRCGLPFEMLFPLREFQQHLLVFAERLRCSGQGCKEALKMYFGTQD